MWLNLANEEYKAICDWLSTLLQKNSILRKEVELPEETSVCYLSCYVALLVSVCCLLVNETENITLSCSYSSAYSLLWYRQDHTSAPQFLMLILQNSGKVIQSSDERLSGKLNVDKNRVDLEIPFSTVKESAVYFCALQTTVTGNQTLLYKNLTA
uniref:T-cell receptor alpha/delta variable 20.0 n=1 Tax=Cyprinus carpio TaxID=7962 RepID=A0A8C2I681_CYPCA